MNDSPYGLTVSIWTNAQDSQEEFLKIVDQLETGTVFLNRSALYCESHSLTDAFWSCDYLDPALAWVGVKDSGRGVSLSKFGGLHITPPRRTLTLICKDMINSHDQNLCTWKSRLLRANPERSSELNVVGDLQRFVDVECGHSMGQHLDSSR